MGCHRTTGLLASVFTMLLVASPAAWPDRTAAPGRKARLTITDLAPVAVSGTLPGPALWKVTKGTHVMWILGVTKPLPKRLQWQTGGVEGVIAGSQAVLRSPAIEITAHLGFWGRAFLLPSLVGLERLPGGKTLRDVLPPDLYDRWEVQRARYLRGFLDVERLRPIFAGEKLYAAAIRRSGLTNDGGVTERVLGFARHDGIPLVNTAYVIIMKDPRRDAKRFKQASMDDQRCLSGILDATGHDLAQATLRANAWATGDLTALRRVLAVQQQDACLSALGNTDFARKSGMNDMAQRMEQAWLKAAEASLEKNQQTMALLPIESVLAPDGYLSALQAQGYVVTAPPG